MVYTSSMGTDYLKFIDKVLYKYQAKEAKVRALFGQKNVDSIVNDAEYTKLLQLYTEARGYEAFNDSSASLAEGERPFLDDIGAITDSTAFKKYGKSWKASDEMLRSNDAIAKELLTRSTFEAMLKTENDVNAALIAAMSANAGSAFTAANTWDTTGDALEDINTAIDTFVKRAGGVEPDFLLFNKTDLIPVTIDDRVVNTLYPENTVKGGKIPALNGLPIMTDTAVTSGDFYMGKRAMFGDIITSMPYKSFEKPDGSAGAEYDITVKYGTQFRLPFYLLKGDGIA